MTLDHRDIYSYSIPHPSPSQTGFQSNLAERIPRVCNLDAYRIISGCAWLRCLRHAIERSRGCLECTRCATWTPGAQQSKAQGAWGQCCMDFLFVGNHFCKTINWQQQFIASHTFPSPLTLVHFIWKFYIILLPGPSKHNYQIYRRAELMLCLELKLFLHVADSARKLRFLAW